MPVAGSEAKISGWSDADVAEFRRRWERGDTIAEMSAAFAIGPTWVTRLRRRLGLPTRRSGDGRYRGGPYGIGHVRKGG